MARISQLLARSHLGNRVNKKGLNPFHIPVKLTQFPGLEKNTR